MMLFNVNLISIYKGGIGVYGSGIKRLEIQVQRVSLPRECLGVYVHACGRMCVHAWVQRKGLQKARTWLAASRAAHMRIVGRACASSALKDIRRRCHRFRTTKQRGTCVVRSHTFWLVCTHAHTHTHADKLVRSLSVWLPAVHRRWR